MCGAFYALVSELDVQYGFARSGFLNGFLLSSFLQALGFIFKALDLGVNLRALFGVAQVH